MHVLQFCKNKKEQVLIIQRTRLLVMDLSNGLTQLKDVQANLATTIELMEMWALKYNEMEKRVHELTEENRRLKSSPPRDKQSCSTAV